MRSSMTCEDKL